MPKHEPSPDALALAAEKKVWRWAKYVKHTGDKICLHRCDVPQSKYYAPSEWTCTEYLGDADGNPAPAMLGPQELWDRHQLYVLPDEITTDWVVVKDTDRRRAIATKKTYAEVLAEANRIAGVAA